MPTNINQTPSPKMYIKIAKHIWKYIFLIISPIVTLAVLLLLFQQLFAKMYDFPQPKPFHGLYLHNPYKDLDTNWYKANFHAHSIAYLGLTNGNQTPKELINKYNSLAYDIPSLSNYHEISDDAKDIQKLYIPCYEHGYNVMKTHRLCIGANEVSYFDFIFHLFKSNKQQLIEELQEKNDLIAIAHPKFRNGHSKEDLKYLTGYDCLEVLNHYRNSFEYWDSALSAGIPAYIIANDDCHNSDSPGETGVNWTMINAPNLDRRAIINALKLGRAYGVEGSFAHNSNYLKEVTVSGDTVSFKFQTQADSIILIGQHGKRKQIEMNQSDLSYVFAKEDTYIRCEAYTDSTEIYLNPIIRYEVSPPVNTLKAEVNYFYTYLWRITAFLLLVVIMYLYYRIVKYCLFICRAK